AMEAGAAGFATSAAITHRAADGRPIPSRLAEPDEIEALCRAVADSGRGVIAVNGGPTLGFTATYEMQERVGIPFTYVALLTTADGKHRRAVEIHRAARARGADVWPQVSCRPLTFSQTLVEPFTLNTNPVFGALLSGDLAERRAAYGDRTWREQVRQAWTAGQGIPPRWDTFEIMESAAHPELVDRKLAASAEEAGTDPFDHLLDLALEEPDLRLRVRATFANDDPDGVADLLQEEGCALGLSDAGAHVSQLCDAPLPTDLLGNWVRGRRALPLEAAVHKLTGEPARLFGFADRGVLATGAYADVVVFDPATVEPGPLRRVRDFPADAERLTADQPTGMHHVWVNGSEALTDGRLTGAAGADRPGRLVSPAGR
ncbi:MAG: amidohydrolase family protein, partial [Acidimicrobiales bacterium]